MNKLALLTISIGVCLFCDLAHASNTLDRECRKTDLSKIPQGDLIKNINDVNNIAYYILIPIYGKDVIEKQYPFSIEKREGVFYVDGDLTRAASEMPANRVLVGGVFHLEICAADGRVLALTHSR